VKSKLLAQLMTKYTNNLVLSDVESNFKEKQKQKQRNKERGIQRLYNKLNHCI